MATPSQLADFARRSRGNPAPSTPVKKLPKLAETLAVFARTEERKQALAEHDAETEKWRQSLSFGGGATLTPAAAAPVAAPTVVSSPPTVVTIPSTVPPVPGPRGLPGLSGVDVPFAMRCPDNGKVYRFTPRTADTGDASGEWVETTDVPTLQFVPRVGDTGDISGEWQAAGVFCQDDGKRYRYVPRLGDSGAITGEWQQA